VPILLQKSAILAVESLLRILEVDSDYSPIGRWRAFDQWERHQALITQGTPLLPAAVEQRALQVGGDSARWRRV
jgi:hypothetical protein